eukprot:11052455-Alexandrium_andersonii.AAC.1
MFDRAETSPDRLQTALGWGGGGASLAISFAQNLAWANCSERRPKRRGDRTLCKRNRNERATTRKVAMALT